MKIRCIAFTHEGYCRGQQVLAGLPGDDVVLACGFGQEKVGLHAWTKEHFFTADALVFIGATGIAVRSIAPLLQTKTSDPAVLVMDEAARYVIPLLSGHVGGANRLARHLAQVCGAQVVLTTATDVRGVWAVDEWAVQAGMTLANPERIKHASARLLRGETLRVFSEVILTGSLPDQVELVDDETQAHVVISARMGVLPEALQVVPRCIAVGVGCRKGVACRAVEDAVLAAFRTAGVAIQSLASVASIDVKSNEAGLLEFCEKYHRSLSVYSAEELSAVAGSQAASEFVQHVVGVDNVCERSALMGGGVLLLPKFVQDGVTVALVAQEVTYQMGSEK